MKKYFLASFLILFTFALLIGGLFLPTALMNKQQQAFFSRTETITLPTETESTSSTNEVTPDEFFNIALSYSLLESEPFWRSYDPSSQPLTTEYLIQTAHEQIKQLCEQDILPELFTKTNYTWENVEYGTTWSSELQDFLSSYEKTSAQSDLNTTENAEDEAMLSSSELDGKNFSGWLVYAGNNNLKVNMIINSATGKILKLSASWFDEQANLPSPEQIQKNYQKYLNAEQFSKEHTASKTLSDYASQFHVELCHYQDISMFEIALLGKLEILQQIENDDTAQTSASEGNYHTLKIYFSPF